MTEEWREYWTPDEYAHMQEVMSPEALDEEMAMRRTKAERLRAAREIGLSDGEGVLMGMLPMMISMGVADSGREHQEEKCICDPEDPLPFDCGPYCVW